ncbi:MAG: hypothetical protein EOP90_14135 [Lysobacteraceae bacterium]|nr:MAG: hypothetical protein EOP90_14135 [Xanthomonadaceae bacterium]
MQERTLCAIALIREPARDRFAARIAHRVGSCTRLRFDAAAQERTLWAIAMIRLQAHVGFAARIA